MIRVVKFDDAAALHVTLENPDLLRLVTLLEHLTPSRIVRPVDHEVGGTLATSAETDDMKTIAEPRRERVEAMDVVSKSGQKQEDVALTAPIEVLQRDAVRFDELIGRCRGDGHRHDTE